MIDRVPFKAKGAFRFLLVSSLAALPLTQARATLIAPARLTTWSAGVTVGVPGGIPTTRTNIVDITQAPYNADPTGATDCHNAILAAINAATPGEVIYLPAGTYLVNETICPNQGKSNYTIRGAGDSTVINWMGTSGELFYLGSGSDYLWNYPAGGVSITGGLSQGSTVLTVASTSAVIDGGLIQIAENNDTTLPTIHVSGYQNQRSQKVQVLSHTATTITLSSGLLWTLQSSLNPVFNVAQFQSNGVGVEDMFVSAGNSTSSFIILFEQCCGSWIYNVHSQLAYNYHFFLMDCLQCQVDHCYLDQLNHIGTNGAGLLMQGTSNSLVQNNIITRAAPHMEINFGSSGNVFAYNFCYDSSSFGVVGPSIDTNHGPHNSYNLYEGNVAPNIQCDGFFGSASEDTVLRNWLFGTAPGVFVPGSSTVLAAREPLLLQRFTRNYNVVGNLLGTKGTPYYSIDSTVATGSPYSFGMPNLGNSSSTGTAQPSLGDYWQDWSIQGTLTNATGANAGVVTVNTTGDMSTASSQASITWAGGIQTNITIVSVSGNTISFSGGGGSANLPAVGTAIQIWPGPGGYQEKDLDVQASVDLKANYDVSNQVEPSADQALGTDTVPSSLYLAAAPSWFGTLAWPAVNAASPYTSNIVSGATGSTGLPLGFESIPAGYRYVHGEDPPTTTSAPSFTGQPASASVTAGNSISFTVAAQGAPAPTLQWQVSTDGGNTWVPLANTGVYSGVTTSVLTITGATSGLNSYQYNCVATNSTAPGTATSNDAVLTVTLPPPVISSTITDTALQNSAFSYTITASNSPTSYNATGLPAGLSVNTGTGVISGTPASTGTSIITISATNASGTGSATLSLTVAAAVSPPVITSSLTASGTKGSSFSYTITASNSPASYSATGLPAGLSVKTSTGVISGTPTAAGISSVTISATNAGGTGSATLSITINAPVSPPSITSSLSVSGTKSSPFSYTITASNSPTSYNATGLPTGLSVNTSTGVISGTPTSSKVSHITISATNSGGTGSASLTLSITTAVSPPVITSTTSASGTQNAAFSYTITGSNSPTSFNATGLPAGLSVNTGTGVISGTPTGTGTSSITISAANTGGTGSATLSLTVNPAHPVISSSTSATGTQNSSFSYTITASNSPTSYNATGLPAGLSVNTGTGVISGTPSSAGASSITISATNAGGTGSATLSLTVAAAISVPVITSSTLVTGTQNSAFSYSITASNSPTSYNATGLPAGLSVNPGTGVISGTPSSAGASSITISATNAGGTGSATLSLTVNPAHPVISSSTSATGTQSSSFSYTITASNSPTSYNATGLPAGLSVNTGTGVISGTPSSAGASSITISATNAGGTGSATLSLTVNPLAPVISSPTTASGTQNSAFSYSITATNSPTSYNATGLPAGLSVNTGTGVISGTPSSAGASSITISATNAGGTGSATLSLTVNPLAPVISSPTTASGTQNSAFSYSITATNSPTSYNAIGLPAGLLINTATGVISGTPTSVSTGNITILATNAGGSGMATLALAINPPAPVITSALTAAGTKSSSFSYSITASNSPTSYNASGLPAGLTVNTSTGVISGTPTGAGATNITISATNAGSTGTATLVLTVNPPAPVITSALSATMIQSTNFAYNITASNSPASYSATGLPTGLTVNTATGAITGTPMAAGNSNVTISAVNASGTGSASLALSVTVATPVITSAAAVTGTQGSPFSYSITATNSPTVYNAAGLPAGLTINTGTGVISGTPSAAGTTTFNIGATNAGGTGVETVSLTVQAPAPTGTLPAFTEQPTSQTVASGHSVAFDSMASGTPAPTYQWSLNGTPISGATDAILLVSGTTSANVGAYTCAATNSAGTVTSNAATLTIRQTSNPGYLSNLSARGYVGSGLDALTGGFEVAGSGSKQVLLRGVGPGLNYIAGLTGVVPDPQLILYNSAQSPINQNEQWGGTTELVNAFNSVGAFPLSTTSLDTALYVSLPVPGFASYTVSVSAGTGGPGTGMFEVYDADSSAPAIRLTNISARALVGSGTNVLVGGFVIGGSTSETVLIRAVGPTLAASPFQLSGTLSQPTLTVYSGNAPIYSNTVWNNDATIASTSATVGAFTLQSNSLDSALLVTLPPGSYTAQASGVSGTSGIAIVEIYEIQ